MLNRFNVGPANLLGKGSESEVYALDDTRVIRLYRPQTDLAYIEQRLALYDLLHQQHPPFELPLVFEKGTLDDRCYTVEQRMRGRAFADVLPILTGDERNRALRSYLRVAEQVGRIRFPGRPFGEMLVSGKPLQCASWPQYLWERLQHTYRMSRADVEQDAPGVDAVLAYMQGALRLLEGFQDTCLVHGDYFPGNVFIDDQQNICGVGDFGYSTVVGDPRMDLAGAVVFLEVVDGYQPDDTAFLMQVVEERHGPGMARWIDFYRCYYSFYFSTCKADDPRTYAWCIGNLRSMTRFPNAL